MALKYAPGPHSHSGGVVLVWHKKSNTLSHSFQINHHPITITISCRSSVTTTTTPTTTTTVEISTTVTLCQCQLTALLLLDLLVQVIADNRLEMQRQRPQELRRMSRWPPVSIELSFGRAPSAEPHPPMLPLATNSTPPPPEPTTAPSLAGRLLAIQAIFAAARSLLYLRRTR